MDIKINSIFPLFVANRALTRVPVLLNKVDALNYVSFDNLPIISILESTIFVSLEQEGHQLCVYEY